MSLDGLRHLYKITSMVSQALSRFPHLWSFFNLCSTYWSTTPLAPLDVTMSATRSLVDTRSRTISKMSGWQQSSRRHLPSSGGGRRGGRLRPGGSWGLSFVSPSFNSAGLCDDGPGFAAILSETPPIDSSVLEMMLTCSVSFPCRRFSLIPLPVLVQYALKSMSSFV